MDRNAKTVKHFFEAAHSVPNVPSLSSMYTVNFFKECNAKMYGVPTQLSGGLKFCENCQILEIPGINMSMRVLYKKQRKGSLRKRQLRYTCLICSHKTLFDLLQPEPKIDKKEESNDTLPLPSQVVDKKKVNKAKERVKRRKENTLSNLLINKKLKQEKQKNAVLSLEDFFKT